MGAALWGEERITRGDPSCAVKRRKGIAYAGSPPQEAAGTQRRCGPHKAQAATAPSGVCDPEMTGAMPGQLGLGSPVADTRAEPAPHRTCHESTGWPSMSQTDPGPPEASRPHSVASPESSHCRCPTSRQHSPPLSDKASDCAEDPSCPAGLPSQCPGSHVRSRPLSQS